MVKEHVVETEFVTPVPIKGELHPDFQEVAETFAKNFIEYNEIGASLCVVVDGEVVVDFWAGHTDEGKTEDWNKETLSIAFSSTKAALALCAHLLIDRGELNPKEKIIKYLYVGIVDRNFKDVNKDCY